MAAAAIRTVRPAGTLRLIDVAVNLADDMYQGRYNGKESHAADLDLVCSRATDAGVERMVCVGGSLNESKQYSELSQKHAGKIFCTVGVHPTRCQEFLESGDPDEHLRQLARVATEGASAVVAVGEIGLDYDREQFCPRDIQKRFFEEQLKLAQSTKLPVIFHNRNTGGDFEAMVRQHRALFGTGIVHSFTGTKEEMKELIDLGLYIGINGCGLKTAELCEMVGEIPTDRLVVETDAPWCEIRPTHASFKHIKTNWPSVKKEKFVMGSLVKNRNEPCHLVHVIEAIAGIKQMDVEELSKIVFANTMNVLWPGQE